MGKGEETRARILHATAPLFNRRGYAGASMAEVMSSAGLEKGGIYRHFPSKEALAIASFDHAIGIVGARIRDVLEREQTAPAQLLALIELWHTLAVDPPVAGGCPLMNTAIESDDGPPALRERARTAMSRLRARVRRIFKEGVARGELRAGFDAEATVSVFIATLEGALMLTRLYGDDQHMRHASAHLTALIHDLATPTAARSARPSTRETT